MSKKTEISTWAVSPYKNPNELPEDLPDHIKSLVSPRWFLEKVKKEVCLQLRKAGFPENPDELSGLVDDLLQKRKPVSKPILFLTNALVLIQTALGWLELHEKENRINAMSHIGPAVAYAIQGGASLERYLPAAKGGMAKGAANAEAWTLVFMENEKLSGRSLSKKQRAEIIYERLNNKEMDFPLRPGTIRKKI